MWVLISLISLFSLFPLLLSLPESPGICIVPHVKEKFLHVYDRRLNKVIIQKYNHTFEVRECCGGYQETSKIPLNCEPICEPSCENSDCEAPGVCVCHPDHVMVNNSSNTCYDVCDSCVNGECSPFIDAKECFCYHGYVQDSRLPHVCNPICLNECINSTCTKPGHCDCLDGYIRHEDPYKTHICVPHCEKGCVHGTCTDPNECSCHQGYINDKDAPSICLPECEHGCENGVCVLPNKCECHDGYQQHPRDLYRCVPTAPANLSLNYCDFVLHQAIKFDDSDCFEMKEKINISVPNSCRVTESKTELLCSQESNCQNECQLYFLCSAKKVNGLNEIHCDLEKNAFIIGSEGKDLVANTTEWTDVVIVLNSYQHINSSMYTQHNVSKEWTLQQLSKGAICGRKSFPILMVMSHCSAKATLGHVNSTFMFWMNVILICGFILMVGAGVGGFLWARHRRINNPLNYRENSGQGYYNNQSYDNRPTELVSDDDSDTSDALL